MDVSIIFFHSEDRKIDAFLTSPEIVTILGQFLVNILFRKTCYSYVYYALIDKF